MTSILSYAQWRILSRIVHNYNITIGKDHNIYIYSHHMNTSNMHLTTIHYESHGHDCSKDISKTSYLSLLKYIKKIINE